MLLCLGFQTFDLTVLSSWVHCPILPVDCRTWTDLLEAQSCWYRPADPPPGSAHVAQPPIDLPCPPHPPFSNLYSF